jgi:hypothetical protein
VFTGVERRVLTIITEVKAKCVIKLRKIHEVRSCETFNIIGTTTGHQL